MSRHAKSFVKIYASKFPVNFKPFESKNQRCQPVVYNTIYFSIFPSSLFLLISLVWICSFCVVCRQLLQNVHKRKKRKHNYQHDQREKCATDKKMFLCALHLFAFHHDMVHANEGLLYGCYWSQICQRVKCQRDVQVCNF